MYTALLLARPVDVSSAAWLVSCTGCSFRHLRPSYGYTMLRASALVVVVYKSSREAQGRLAEPIQAAIDRPDPLSAKAEVGEDGRPCPPRLLLLPCAPPRPANPAPRVRLRPLRPPLQGRLLHLLAHPCRRLLWVRRRGGGHGRRLPRRRGPRAVPGRRRLRRLLPGPVQGQQALRRGGRPGGRHGPRQDQPHRPRAQQPGLRRHGAPRHGRAPRRAAHRRCRVQEGAVRVQAPEPLGEGGGEEPRPRRADRQVPLPGRPDRHRRRRRRAGRFVQLEVHDARLRPGVEHEPGAAGAAAAQGGGDRRVRRQVGLGRPRGPPAAVARRRGLRHGRPDRRHRPGGLLPLRHARVGVTQTVTACSPKPKLPVSPLKTRASSLTLPVWPGVDQRTRERRLTQD
ncbi:hypothetical protein GQ55_9G625900 [Panicum hallii var. hallii]|uniref:Uncharacterized protein n=1 Tax=Panicum hallii var. hallii TaxID=1504633 RepID=A0A2T7CI52_9POAL|nr:hypothetical protein GQ55_9G625900 [Panicum hallii var. hallii]